MAEANMGRGNYGNYSYKRNYRNNANAESYNKNGHYSDYNQYVNRGGGSSNYGNRGYGNSVNRSYDNFEERSYGNGRSIDGLGNSTNHQSRSAINARNSGYVGNSRNSGYASSSRSSVNAYGSSNTRSSVGSRNAGNPRERVSRDNEVRTRANVEPMRVYAPSMGQLAYKTDTAYSSARLAAQPVRRVEPTPAAPKPRRVQKPNKQHVPLSEFLRVNHVYSRVAACALVAAVAVAALFTLLGYESISNAQKEINHLNKQIEQTNTLLDELNMEYLFSLDVTAAQAAAEAAGMTKASAITPVNP
ncbi:MAG: hypothetical protein J1E60_02325 [Christensenellaceae bacterium]|nr:hypothetical protein [Christensenellaceae bacterium]